MPTHDRLAVPSIARAPWDYEIPSSGPLKVICHAPKQSFPRKHTEDFQNGNDVMRLRLNILGMEL